MNQGSRAGFLAGVTHTRIHEYICKYLRIRVMHIHHSEWVRIVVLLRCFVQALVAT